ncbi:MAG: molybdopterin cofactor-binding domain-containing protein, partial [Caldimonas sp.]
MLAIVGRTYWHARRGVDAIEVAWQAPPSGPLDTRTIEAGLLQRAQAAAADGSGFTFYSRGDAAHAVSAAARQIERVYRAPYLAHATMEPINCTARVRDRRVELWAATQVPGMARALAARVAGVAESAVIVHVTYLGGGFGRRLEVDVIGQVVRIALETDGRPVQLVWSREEDNTHDFYRPAGVAVLRAVSAPRVRCPQEPGAASRCTRASAASSRRRSRSRSSMAGRACSGSSARPTSAPSSTRASSRS